MPPAGYTKDATLPNFLKKVDTSGDCWLWTKKALRNGFPALNTNTWGTPYARQWIYHFNGGELKPDTTLYSTCKNNLCCNPAHLTYDDPVPLFTQFMEKINQFGSLPVGKETLGACWVWTGACAKGFGGHTKGHGCLNREKWGEGLAHRWIYKFTHPTEDISANTINHRCDVPFCVNPAHLIAGSQSGNMSQMTEQTKAHNQRIRDKAHALEIRKRILDGVRTKDLVIELGCSKVCIADLKMGRTWNEPECFPPGWV